jgi:hypothetical protein
MILHTQYNYSTTLIISLHIYLSLIGVEFGIRAYPQDNCHTFVKLNSCRLTEIAVALALLLGVCGPSFRQAMFHCPDCLSILGMFYVPCYSISNHING